MSGRQVYCLSPRVLFASFGDGGVIFSLETREAHCLNPTAANAIDMLDGNRSVTDIIAALSAENEINPQIVKSDVESFLKDIKNRGWLDVR